MNSDIYHQLDSQDLVNTLNECIAELSPREQLVLVMKYEDNLSYARIAGLLGKSDARANQIVHEALRKLRRPSRINKLQEFRYTR